jgi:hypothetical protein
MENSLKIVQKWKAILLIMDGINKCGSTGEPLSYGLQPQTGDRWLYWETPRANVKRRAQDVACGPIPAMGRGTKTISRY